MIYLNKKQYDYTYVLGKEHKVHKDIYQIDYVSELTKNTKGKYIITWCSDINYAMQIGVYSNFNKREHKIHIEKMLRRMNLFGKLDVYYVECVVRVKYKL